MARQRNHQHLDDERKKVAQTEERKQKAIQLDLKEVRAKKLNLTESMKGMHREATYLTKQAEVKNGFHVLRNSNTLREKAAGKLRNYKLLMMSKQN